MTWIDDQPIYRLYWEDGPRAGLVVAARGRSFAALAAVERFDRRAVRGPVRARDVAELAAVFIEHVESWTITARTGRRVPVSVARFLALDRDVVLVILREWCQVVRAGALAEAEPDTPVEDLELEAEPAPARIEDQLSAVALTEPDPEREFQVA